MKRSLRLSLEEVRQQLVEYSGRLPANEQIPASSTLKFVHSGTKYVKGKPVFENPRFILEWEEDGS